MTSLIANMIALSTIIQLVATRLNADGMYTVSTGTSTLLAFNELVVWYPPSSLCQVLTISWGKTTLWHSPWTKYL